MRPLRLTPAARRDLGDIWDHSAGNWGPAQAERYLRLLQAACAALASGQRLAQPAGHIRPGYFRLSAGSHLLFFREAADGAIEIIRILHRHMDVARHLPGDP